MLVKIVIWFLNDKQSPKIDVWLGKEDFVETYTNEDIYKTIKKAKKKLLKVSKESFL